MREEIIKHGIWPQLLYPTPTAVISAQKRGSIESWENREWIFV